VAAHWAAPRQVLERYQREKVAQLQLAAHMWAVGQLAAELGLADLELGSLVSVVERLEAGC
jgi:hypothetical protein